MGLHRPQAVTVSGRRRGQRLVGKTQVALEYMYRYMAHYDVMWWLSAAREALRQGVPYAHWLLIFDNSCVDQAARTKRKRRPAGRS